MSNTADTGGTGSGRIVLRTFLAFLAGTFATFLVTLFGTLLFWELAGISDREGGGAMALAFFIAPVVGLFGGIFSAFWAAARLKRRAAAGAQASRLSRGARIALAAVPAAALGYLVGFLIVWIFLGPVSTSVFLALVYAWLPIVLAVLSAGLAWRFADRSRPD